MPQALPNVQGLFTGPLYRPRASSICYWSISCSSNRLTCLSPSLQQLPTVTPKLQSGPFKPWPPVLHQPLWPCNKLCSSWEREPIPMTLCPPCALLHVLLKLAAMQSLVHPPHPPPTLLVSCPSNLLRWLLNKSNLRALWPLWLLKVLLHQRPQALLLLPLHCPKGPKGSSWRSGHSPPLPCPGPLLPKRRRSPRARWPLLPPLSQRLPR